MFTGIIQDIGVIVDLVQDGDWRLTIKTNALSLSHTSIGASIACSGICLTVIDKTDNTFSVQASAETIGKTGLKDWRIGTRLNLEPALRMGDELGGHLVTGHVDGVARIVSRAEENASLRLRVEAPQQLARFIAAKGSVTLDGVSLTVNEADGACFGVNIIPHTQQATTLGERQSGDAVNFEVDMIARYTDRLLHAS